MPVECQFTMGAAGYGLGVQRSDGPDAHLNIPETATQGAGPCYLGPTR
jgi:hypothetical protein